MTFKRIPLYQRNEYGHAHDREGSATLGFFGALATWEQMPVGSFSPTNGSFYFMYKAVLILFIDIRGQSIVAGLPATVKNH